eukprot:12406670-Karenia_brevis.AAC.1
MKWPRVKVISKPASARLDSSREQSALEQKFGESWFLEQSVFDAVNRHGWANHKREICPSRRYARAQD